MLFSPLIAHVFKEYEKEFQNGNLEAVGLKNGIHFLEIVLSLLS